jgi:hypothetical protein
MLPGAPGKVELAPREVPRSSRHDRQPHDLEVGHVADW